MVVIKFHSGIRFVRFGTSYDAVTEKGVSQDESEKITFRGIYSGPELCLLTCAQGGITLRTEKGEPGARRAGWALVERCRKQPLRAAVYATFAQVQRING